MISIRKYRLLCTKDETMVPLHMATLTVKRELPKYEIILGSLPYLCTEDETMAPLHMATLTVKRELPKYEIIFGSLPYLCTEDETMVPLHMATLTVKRELYIPKYEDVYQESTLCGYTLKDYLCTYIKNETVASLYVVTDTKESCMP